MAFTRDYSDLSYGDETRLEGDYVGLPHDESTDGLKEGEVVAWDSANDKIVAADVAGGFDPIGVLYTYQYYTDNSGGETIDQNANATVKVAGTVKAEVESSVNVGPVTASATSGSAGHFNNTDADASSNFTALTDAQQQDRDDGTTAYYAEVLLR